jgi:ubiquinone/menaquinone biosynthesis C-methylase UbiE
VDPAEVREATRREFAKQAPSFEASGSLFRDRSILDWIADHVPVPAGAQVLDVAGGTGQTGRHLASRGASAVIVDLTLPMLAAGLRAVREEGRGDVVFVRGDAVDLPFPDDQFDVVVCRFALHHMDDPSAAVAEMARVCRAQGGVTLIDLVTGGARHDELERLRDPSHTRSLREDELRELLAGAGREPDRVAVREHVLSVDGWLEQAQTPPAAAEEIRAALEAEAGGGPPSGLRSGRTDAGELTIRHRWVLMGG